MSKEKTILILRWIGIIPASAAAFVIASYMVEISTYLVSFIYGISKDGVVYKLLLACMPAHSLMATCVMIAPKFKKQISLYMLLALTVLMTAIIIDYYGNQKYWEIASCVATYITFIISREYMLSDQVQSSME